MLALLGLLLILSSSFVRGIWRVRVRPFYRKPDAIEPSSLGFRVRSAALLGTGLVALAFSIVQIVAITDEGVGSTAGPDAGERCSDLAAQVGHPPSLSKAEDAISDAAGGSMATRWIAKRCPRTRRSGPGGGVRGDPDHDDYDLDSDLGPGRDCPLPLDSRRVRRHRGGQIR